MIDWITDMLQSKRKDRFHLQTWQMITESQLMLKIRDLSLLLFLVTISDVKQFVAWAADDHAGGLCDMSGSTAG